ncbi:MAG TPA: penicillin-binding protein 2 [Devosiaceae bacterium]|nr:penicillin-binding protein 2 [Devosiaceae bacterium]
MAIMTGGDAAPISLTGAKKFRGDLTRTRIRWVIIGLVTLFLIVCGRLVQLGMVVQDTTIEGRTREAISASRPAILDRNGLEMAVDIRVPSLYAEPRRIIDVDDAVEKLRTVLPDLDPAWLRNKLSGEKGFVWIKRDLTPALEDKIYQLGIPGLDFLTESKRFYPGGPEASHILGSVNVDNQGIGGIEQYIDSQGLAQLQSVGIANGGNLKPVQLSIDMRVQHVMRQVLLDALTRYQAKADAGVMIDVKTGEVLGLVSLPDFDPNDPSSMIAPYNGEKAMRFNRITAGKYELGSTFKTVTIAGALDAGAIKMTDQFDARFGVRFGRFTITDFHGQHRMLSLPEVYKYSSNVGAIHIEQTWGKDNFRGFMTKVGFDSPLPIELPEKTTSYIPKTLSDVTAATASFGHGISITPLHMAAAMAAFVNNGVYEPPTVYKRTPQEVAQLAKRFISPKTSLEIRELMRLNGIEGSGSVMNRLAEGYRVGGKTGTAEKVENGRYSRSKNFNVFASAFPMDAPKYAMVVIIDEPHRESATTGDTAGWNAGEITGRIVAGVAPMLGVAPNFDQALDDQMVPVSIR